MRSTFLYMKHNCLIKKYLKFLIKVRLKHNIMSNIYKKLNQVCTRLCGRSIFLKVLLSHYVGITKYKYPKFKNVYLTVNELPSIYLLK